MAPILGSQNNETAAMFVSQTSPLGVEIFSYVIFVRFFAVVSHEYNMKLPETS